MKTKVRHKKQKLQNPGVTEPGKERKEKETSLQFIASLAVTLIVGFFIMTFNLQAFAIPSGSMESTLLVGDHVFVDRITLAPTTHWMPAVHYREIHRGDIIVFLSPVEPGVHVVKRVIGIPGDRIHLRNGVVYRNGEKLDEPYINYEGMAPDPYAENFPTLSPLEANYPLAPSWRMVEASYVHDGEIVVPQGQYFGMGDHRNISWDSRYFGFIPQENIIGRPLFIWWSFITPEDEQEKNPGERLRFLLSHEVLHFFDETRWSRTLRRVQ